jgi:hypothetical protein
MSRRPDFFNEFAANAFSKLSEGSLGISIENLAKELLFVAKRSVKTGAVDAHGPGEVGRGGAFVTFGEGARSSALCRRSIQFHTYG